MIQRKKKIVLYQPKQVDETLGLESSKDMLPLEMLTIAAFPLEDGYDVVIVDGSLFAGDAGHRRLLEECEDAMLVATTGILGYMVNDGYQAMTKVKGKFPKLPAVIGGWFASVRPDLQLETGYYECVVLGQGELTFRDVVRAIDAGVPLDDIEGLALWRDGQVVKTPRRPIVDWKDIPDVPWHLIDIEPYKLHQMRAKSARDVLRLPTPPWIGYGKPYFGITYFGSYGCPEPCTFCCSPIVTDRRWKPMPADRMLDDLEMLHERWGFDSVRFHDANWGVQRQRSRDFAEGLLNRNLQFGWNAFIETHSILTYPKDTLDMMAESGMYVAEIGAEAGTDNMMKKIGKPIYGDDNIEAAVEMDRRGVQGSITYIIGYPHESEESMIATIDQCRRLHNAAPLARPNVWPFRPIPGTVMWDQAVALGYEGPKTLPEWGSIGEYHLEETWPGVIPERVKQMRMMYQHYATMSYGLARGKIGWWEKRAQARLDSGSYVHGQFEARAFGLYNKVRKKLFNPVDVPRSWVDPGHKTGTAGNAKSKATEAMTDATKG
ncbi:MAG: B12-binding domain-containing radical SAM protein [Planctomycetes bacterium]|nr:B12-binding domain-containing radical SAM protein [Planctomycetota bacterium]MCB9910781.1 B12-binding domain-containing radical SAM protein [Planctomycetota bacterium]MCB9912807.1 B12-binding domain-containing radical SAM protein [Planctomycetota bacterium]HPF15621.1 radical SAM protein [Planctomycetota bacterium]